MGKNKDFDKETLIAEIKESVRAELLAEMNISTPQEEVIDESGDDDFLTFTVSGCYYNSKKETFDFHDLNIKIPANDEEVASMHLRGRYILKAVTRAKKPNGDPMYPSRVHKIRQVHVDSVKPSKGKYSFVGKGIKQLSIDELQDLATRKDLRFIPLPDSGMSLRDMQIRAYVDYSDKFLRKKIKWQDSEFNFAKLPDITLDGWGRIDDTKKFTNDEIVALEQAHSKPINYGERDNPKNRFTLDELKKIADSKNIAYPDNVNFDDLYINIFPIGL